MSLGRCTAWLCLILGCAVGGAAAQDLPTPQSSTVDLSPFLRPGQRVRISGEALRRVGGAVVNLRSDTIVISGAEGQRPIPLAQVDTLWTRGTWMWQGMLLAGSAGVIAAGATCVFGVKERCPELAYGAIAGVAAGFVIGKLRIVYNRRFARRDGGPVPILGPWVDR
jgi:hypothetical protein